jgi:hypothetical protein
LAKVFGKKASFNQSAVKKPSVAVSAASVVSDLVFSPMSLFPRDAETHMAALAAEFPDAPLYCICRTERPYRIELEEKALKSIDVKKPPVVDVLPWESGITQVLLSAKSA